MQVDLFDFDLPEDRIATRPVTPRDAARLLCVGKSWPYHSARKEREAFGADFSDKTIAELPNLLFPGDLLVLNNTKVIPARLFGKRGDAKVEVTLHKRIIKDELRDTLQLAAGARENVFDSGGRSTRWRCFAKPGKKLKVGDVFEVAPDFSAEVEAKLESGEVILRFNCQGPDLYEKLAKYGSMPLPPYMKRDADENDVQQYQTLFAKAEGAVAAPTAGLHFTPELLQMLDMKGIESVEVTLHVGAGTFLPVKADDTRDHQMHSEDIVVTAEQARIISNAKREGRRIVAIGTTALRVLETITDRDGVAHPFMGETDIFITPGYQFKCVDVLLTNFHLPRSTLFMLVSAFSGLERMKAAYQHAIDNHYRFYSYGDACLLERAEQ